MNKNYGFSLIELLVGILISSFIILGVAQVFISNRKVFSNNESLSRVQETGRFVMEEIAREIRMAGHMGCTNTAARMRAREVFVRIPGATNPSSFTGVDWSWDFSQPITAYEAQGTQSGQRFSSTLSTAGVWGPALPPQLRGRVAAGSDVIVIRYLGVEARNLTSPAQSDNPTLVVGGGSGFIRSGRVYGLTDCNKASVFIPTNISADGRTFIAQSVTGAEQYSINDTQVFEGRSIAYYVGPNQRGGLSLFKLELTPTNTTAPEELHDNVLNLQFMYGIDTSPTLPDGGINEYRLGDQVTGQMLGAEPVSWRVGAVRVGVLIGTDAPDVNMNDRTPRQVLGVDVTPLNGNEIRHVYERTVAVRNNLFSY